MCIPKRCQTVLDCGWKCSSCIQLGTGKKRCFGGWTDFKTLSMKTAEFLDDGITNLDSSSLADFQAENAKCGFSLWFQCGAELLKAVAKCIDSQDIVLCIEELPSVAEKCWPCISKAIGVGTFNVDSYDFSYTFFKK